MKFTLERRQSNDCAWLRRIESPISAQVLFRIASINFLALNGRTTQPSGFHLQKRYPISGRPFVIQSCGDSMNLQLSLVYAGPEGLGIHSPVKRSHESETNMVHPQSNYGTTYL